MGRNRRTVFTLLLTLLALTAMFSVAHARVDLLNASFESKWIDLDKGGVKLTRTYSSRSTYNGLFGYGWCSPLEARLDFEGGLFLKECDRTTNLVGQRLDRKQDSLILFAKDKSYRVFDASNGRLTEWGTMNGRSVKLSYTRSGLLQDAAAGEGLRMRFEIDTSIEKVRRIEIAGMGKLEFEYSGLDLVKAKNAWSNTYLFTYDTLHNLTQVAFPDSTSERITYDEDRDQVLIFSGRNGCRENYTYQSPGPNRSIAEATKYCDGKTPESLKLESEYGESISRLVFTKNGKKQIKEFRR